MNDLNISKIRARQILDSRGNPTVEADVYLGNGCSGRASVPSGASTGSGEAMELRDNDAKFYNGKGVNGAVWNINFNINNLLTGKSSEQKNVDQLLCELDGTENKSKLGANAILAVSLATAKAVANSKQLPFYRYVADLAGISEISLPMPMMNVINGGEHASWSTDIQEYMIIPKSAKDIQTAIRMGAEVFHSLKTVLAECGYATTVGDEGGFAPQGFSSNIEPLQCLKMAVEKIGYDFGKDIVVALDVAASEFYQNGKYILKTTGETKTADEMIDWYIWMKETYPIVSIEDGLSENDYKGWKKLTEKLGDKTQLVGDDLFVTNSKLLKRGIDEKSANAILIKPNQIGTLSETIETVLMAKEAGYKTIISHRSGETEDTTIAHLAVGLGAGQIKTGSLSRSERICKYNELLRISEYKRNLELTNPFDN